MGSVDWKIINAERILMRAQCIDGRPGLSEREMRIAAGLSLEGKGLLAQYLLRFGDGTGTRKDIASQFIYAERNLAAAVQTIARTSALPGASQVRVKTAVRRFEPSPRPLLLPETFFLGAYSFSAPKPVSPADAARFRLHLLTSFWRNGVRFRPGEVNVSAVQTGTPLNPGSEITVAFPVRPCSSVPAVPAKPVRASKRRNQRPASVKSPARNVRPR
ncbi:MAG TPA: hypothetical protein VFX30_08245 [bacterium]|nr:hypothetical protein [bacterium]